MHDGHVVQGRFHREEGGWCVVWKADIEASVAGRCGEVLGGAKTSEKTSYSLGPEHGVETGDKRTRSAFIYPAAYCMREALRPLQARIRNRNVHDRLGVY